VYLSLCRIPQEITRVRYFRARRVVRDIIEHTTSENNGIRTVVASDTNENASCFWIVFGKPTRNVTEYFNYVPSENNRGRRCRPLVRARSCPPPIQEAPSRLSVARCRSRLMWVSTTIRDDRPTRAFYRNGFEPRVSSRQPECCVVLNDNGVAF